MAEWSNAHDSKSCYVGTRTEVRILFSAPKQADSFCYPPVLLFGMGMKTFFASYRRIRADPPRDEQGILKTADTCCFALREERGAGRQSGDRGNGFH